MKKDVLISSIKNQKIMKHYDHEHTVAPLNPKKGFGIHLFVFLLTTPSIWLVWSLTDRSYPWPIWSTSAWTIGILFHYLGVFVFKKSNVSKKKQSQLIHA
jgi:hypothetical protein